MKKRKPVLHPNPVIRHTLFAIGWISFVLGIIGLLLPVIPTSPFLILTAFCFLNSSPRFYHWLTTHRLFGLYVRYYLDGEGIPRRVKWLILGMLWVMILSSAFVIVRSHGVAFTMITIAALVSVYIVRLPEPAPAPASDRKHDQE